MFVEMYAFEFVGLTRTSYVTLKTICKYRSVFEKMLP